MARPFTYIQENYESYVFTTQTNANIFYQFLFIILISLNLIYWLITVTQCRTHTFVDIMFG